jgi:hypothetical protein
MRACDGTAANVSLVSVTRPTPGRASGLEVHEIRFDRFRGHGRGFTLVADGEAGARWSAALGPAVRAC